MCSGTERRGEGGRWEEVVGGGGLSGGGGGRTGCAGSWLQTQLFLVWLLCVWCCGVSIYYRCDQVPVRFGGLLCARRREVRGFCSAVVNECSSLPHSLKGGMQEQGMPAFAPMICAAKCGLCVDDNISAGQEGVE